MNDKRTGRIGISPTLGKSKIRYFSSASYYLQLALFYQLLFKDVFLLFLLIKPYNGSPNLDICPNKNPGAISPGILKKIRYKILKLLGALY
jgi:hypothetical protein